MQNAAQRKSDVTCFGSEAPRALMSALASFPSNDGQLSPFSSATEVISFGTDCSAVPASAGLGTPCASANALQTRVGWDNVTGVGTPNAQAFVEYFRPDGHNVH
jgi:hypothetical protein